MQFALTEDQELFRRSVRDMLEQEWMPSRVRAAWGKERGSLLDLWSRLVEAGVPAIMVPERFGGLGLGALDLVLVLEECGRALAAGPIVETAAVALPLLAEIAEGMVEGASQGARDLAAGCLADMAERTGRDPGAGPVVTALLSPDLYVPFAREASLMVIERKGALYLLSPAEAELEEQTSVDGSRRIYRATFEPSAGSLLLGAVEARSAIERAFDRGALGVAAELIGITAKMIEMTVEYAKIREQFGQPIGSFQAVKHALAGAYLQLEMSRPLVLYAAYSIGQVGTTGSGGARAAVSMAKARASEAALFASRVALQVHGAIGYSFEHDLHLWMKRAWVLAATFGDSAFHRARVGEAILGASEELE